MQALIDSARRYAPLSSFVASVVDQFDRKGSISPRQEEALNSVLTKMAAKPVNTAPAKSGDIDVSAIHAMFDRAQANGLKRPKFRADGLQVSLAPSHGANAGALYVKNGEEYFGKIMGGKYLPTQAAPADTLSKLQAIAIDPEKVAKAYGQKTGQCGMCGLELTNSESIELGIGPICRSKWLG